MAALILNGKSSQVSVSLVPGTSDLPRQSRSKRNWEAPPPQCPRGQSHAGRWEGCCVFAKAGHWERPFNTKNDFWSKKRRANDKDICRVHPDCPGQPWGAHVLPCVLSVCQGSLALSSFSSSVSSLSPAVSGWNEEDQQSRTKRSLLRRAVQPKQRSPGNSRFSGRWRRKTARRQQRTRHAGNSQHPAEQCSSDKSSQPSFRTDISAES